MQSLDLANDNLRFDPTHREWVFHCNEMPDPPPGCAPTGRADADEVVCSHGVTCCCPTCPADDEHYYIPVPPSPFVTTNLHIDTSTFTAFNYSTNTTNTISTYGDFTITPYSPSSVPEGSAAPRMDDEEREALIQRFLERASTITASRIIAEEPLGPPAPHLQLELGEEDIPDEDF